MLRRGLETSLPDDPEKFKGLPVGIQLVGPSLQEEVVLGLGEVVDAALKCARSS